MKGKFLFWILFLCSTQLFSQSPIVNNKIPTFPIRICMNATVSFIQGTIASGGNGTINYKWICSYTSESTGYVDAPGINNSQNYYPQSPFTDTVWYKRVVTSGTFVDTSNVYTVFVLTKFAEIQQNNPSIGSPICEGNSVSFSAPGFLSSSHSTLIGIRWTIDSLVLINGNSSISKKFLSPGNYNVKLVVEYTGCSDSITKVITVLPKPKAKIGILTNSMQCLGTNSFSFIDSSSYSGGNYSRKWILSDIPGDTSIIVNPIITYDSIGSYAVKLTVTAPNGCYSWTAQQVDVIKSISNNSILGNQTICSGETPASLTGTIPTGTNSGLLKEEFKGRPNNKWSQWIPEDHGWYSTEEMWRTNDPSTSDFAGFIDTRYVEQTRSFLTTKKFTPSNLGDSLRFDVSAIMYCYYQGCQSYDSLTIYASNGNVFKKIRGWVTSLTVDTLTDGVTTKNVIYYGCNGCVTFPTNGPWVRKRLALPPGTTQVKFEFYSSKTYFVDGFQFDNVEIDSSTSKVIEYKWLVSTKSATSGFALANGINNGQNYSPQNLTQTSWLKRVVFNNGFSDTSAAVKVNVMPTSSNFFVNSVSQCLNGNLFVFNDTFSVTNGAINRKWNFGESLTDTSSLMNISKTYSNSGNYMVTLTATRNGNCKDSLTKMITVKPSPIIGSITGDTVPTSITVPFVYSVTSQPNATYNWSVTNGTIQSGQGTNTINLIWSNAGAGNLKANITNNDGCVDSTSLAANISSVGFNNLSLDNKIKVFPNPAKSTITIAHRNNLVSKKYIITNLIGQTVLSGKLNAEETIINLENLQSGVYLLHIDGMNKQSIKVIRE